MTQDTLKPFAITAALCLLTALATPFPALADPPFAQMRETTVRVLCLKPPATGIGSGFVVGGGEYVVTNWHVIACTAEGGVSGVFLSRDHKVEAKVAWKSVQKDLAILKLNSTLNRPSARFAVQGAVADNEKVWAVGFPGAADREEGVQDLGAASVSDGIISRVTEQNRDGVNVKFYQITAAINPGNSGGPLFNEYGQVIGINTQKSLVMVPVIDPAAPQGIGTERVPLGEGVGWAIQADELLEELDTLHIPYEKIQDKPNPLMRLWYRDSLVFSGLAAAVVLGACALMLLLTRRGREVAKHAVTQGVDYVTRRHPPAAPSKPVVTPAWRPVLRGVSGPYAGSVVELDDRPLAIGRDPRLCQLVMPSTATDIGRRHCIVYYDAGTESFTLEDCWSSNGTFISKGINNGLGGGSPIEPGRKHTLRAGDGFYLSAPEYRFVVDMENT